MSTQPTARSKAVVLAERLTACHAKDTVKPVFTPAELADEMISRLPSLAGNVLVISDLGLLVSVLKRLKAEGKDRSQVTFVAHTPEQEAFSQSLAVKVLRVGYNDPIAQLKKYLMELSFDITAANPPYKAGMHLQFLNTSIDRRPQGGEVLYVHPAEWLVQKRATRKNIKVYKPLRDRLKAFHVTITLIDNPWIEVGLYVPLTITHITEGQGVTLIDNRTRAYGGTKLTPRLPVELESLDDVTQWGSPKEATSFLKKVWSHVPRWAEHERVKHGDWYVNLSSLTGNGQTTFTYHDGVTRSVYNMYSLVNSTSLEVTNAPQIARPQGGKEVGNEKRWVSFQTREEAQHALDFTTRSKFFRVFLAMIKIDQHGADSLLGDIPWLDWTQEWTDDRLASFFGLTKEERDMIDAVMDQISL